LHRVIGVCGDRRHRRHLQQRLPAALDEPARFHQLISAVSVILLLVVLVVLVVLVALQANISEEFVMMSEPDHIFLRPIPNFMKRDDWPAAFPFFYIEAHAVRALKCWPAQWSGHIPSDMFSC
jgi:hypothetical protein